MKNKKLIKLASTPIILTGVVCPSLILSSCRDSNDPEKHDIKNKLCKLDLSNINSSEDLLSVNRPLSIRNNSQTYFYLTYRIPTERVSALNLEIWYRVADDYGKDFADWKQITDYVQEGESPFNPIKVNPKEIIQIAISTKDDDYLGFLSDQESGQQISFALTNEDGCEFGEGATIGGNARSLLGHRIYDGSGPFASNWSYSQYLLQPYCFYNLFRPTWTATKEQTEFYINSNFISEVSPSFLPFTNVTEHCYDSMFKGCSSLLVAPALPATKHLEYVEEQWVEVDGLRDGCYQDMFADNKLTLTAAPYLPATTLAYDCYKNMFKNCQNLEYAKIAYVGDMTDMFFSNWMYGVERTGVMYYNGKYKDSRGVDSIPANWSVVQDDTFIANNTVDITVTADPESSRVESHNVVRAYKDQTFEQLSMIFKYLPSPLYTQDVWEYWAEMKDGKLQEIKNIESKKMSELPSAIYPRYGYHPEIDAKYTNISTLDTTKITFAKTASDAKVEYKIAGSADDWQTLDSGHEFEARQQILLRGNIKSTSASNYTNLKITGKAKLGGTVMSLVQTTDDVNPSTIPCAFSFYKLFYGSTGITEVDSTFLSTYDGTKYIAIEDLTAETANVCYGSMFENCTYLTQAPDAPATKIGVGNYYCMFKGCSRLEEFGEISAKQCASAKQINGTYYGAMESMFENCGLLTKVAPTSGLQIETGHYGMYHRMFYGCTKLTNPPNMEKLESLEETGIASISAKKINDDDEGNYGICSCMFENCTSMINPPTRMTSTTATKLGKYACQCMFYGCTKLEQTPAWSFAVEDSYHEKCCKAMFKSCSGLKKCVSSLGGCTTTVNSYGKNIFHDMFKDCSSLTIPPEIPYFNNPSPGTWGTDNKIFHYMFCGCKSLILAGYRNKPTISGYTLHEFVIPYGYKTMKYGMSKNCSNMFNTSGTYYEYDNCGTWSEQGGSADYSSSGTSGQYHYAYLTPNS